MNETSMPPQGVSTSGISTRGELVRHAVIFQLKLVADGLRDLLLVPIALLATVIGFLRGGDDPGREFCRGIDLGRASEAWVNLFGQHESPDEDNNVASIDALFSKVEKTLKQHYQASGTSEKAQAEIEKALQAAHRKTTKK